MLAVGSLRPGHSGEECAVPFGNRRLARGDGAGDSEGDCFGRVCSMTRTRGLFPGLEQEGGRREGRQWAEGCIGRRCSSQERWLLECFVGTLCGQGCWGDRAWGLFRCARERLGVWPSARRGGDTQHRQATLGCFSHRLWAQGDGTVNSGSIFSRKRVWPQAGGALRKGNASRVFVPNGRASSCILLPA